MTREPDSAEDIVGELEAVRASVAQLLAGVARAPSVLRVSSGEVTVELRWDGEERSAASVQPAASVSPPAEGFVPQQTVVAGEMPKSRGLSINAPTVGVFYRAPQPGAQPFVGVGDVVSKGQQVAIIEAMKFMIPVEADRAGRIVEVLKADTEQVEYGEPLLIIEPITDR